MSKGHLASHCIAKDGVKGGLIGVAVALRNTLKEPLLLVLSNILTRII